LLSSVYLSKKKNIVPNPLIRTVLEIIIALVFFPDFLPIRLIYTSWTLSEKVRDDVLYTCREKQKLMQSPEAESKEKTLCMGPYAGADYNLTLCPLQSRLQHIHQWATLCLSRPQTYARVDLFPQSGT
jgi:hypothetical protein